ncbi:probable ATP-dependent RNA helicase DHX58 [Lytechinus variegatus]|uniref:probable ATP-dependent RNA helicase DHX58 n=1 Tax=Lytechinus variegatus TaxID=7654 RepID=UPI001BB19E7C|nr:probable ATP-dependent RNA helicase DHX58 [Lytechinus variegatus]
MAAASVDAPGQDELEDNKIKLITEVYRPILLENLDVRDIAEHLKVQFVGGDDGSHEMFKDVLELIETSKATRKEITNQFLDALQTKKDKRGLFCAVVDALYQSDNDAIARHLEGTRQLDTKKREHYRSFLWLYANRLEDIEPLCLIADLKEYLTKRDSEKIRKTVCNQGNCAGATELLLRLDRKSEDCFKEFIQALQRHGVHKLAKEMEDMKNFALGISPDDDDNDVDNGLNGEDIPVVGNTENTKEGEFKPISLYDYQEEVLTPALKRKNAMVVLPTGTGKTEVAIALIDRLFLNRGQPCQQKTVFVVNKVPLVKQQKDRCLKYLEGKCRVAGASGEELNHVPLDIVIGNNDIVVLTAQVLVNALKDENIKLTLSDIALLILDECHHCQKSNPYNILMALYRDLKLNSPRSPRPQILGLTASPGVGNSKDIAQAEEYITKLCANLDCRISRPSIYAHKLGNKKNSPKEIQKIVKGRSLEDGYFREISVIMECIEDRIKDVEAGRTLVEENDEFTRMASRRGTQGYEQSVVNLRKKIQQEVEDEDDRRELMTCVNYLRQYNNSLFVNRDARTSDAIAYMEAYIDEEEISNPSGPVDMILKKMFRDKLDNLNRIANLHVNSVNPVLNELGNQLKKEYKKNADSLSIIFTRTRESAKALVKWLNEDPELGHLNADLLIGSGNQGMTSTEQNRNLQLFKDKKYKIMVATSVAEEGLDITDCNMVFRYNYVTSDIGHVQTKGRSRAKFNGKIVVIVNSDLQLQDRELKNIIRVKMSEQAIKNVADAALNDEKAFEDKIALVQKKDQKERQREKDLARANKAKKEERTGIVLHCIKCFHEACSLDDIRSIRNQHHVVMNDLFLGKIQLVDLKKQPLIDEFKHQQKIHCGNCQHKWGTMVVYQQEKLPLIAVKNFTLKDGNGRKWFPKSWKEVPFVVHPIDISDLGKRSNEGAVADPEVVQENGEIEEDDGPIEFSNIMQVDD